MNEYLLPVIEHKEIAPEIFSLYLKGNLDDFEPGQFVQVEVSESLEPFLRRPISICEIDKKGIRLVYRTKGRGTKLLAQKLASRDQSNVGGTNLRIFGPLGHGFPIVGDKATLIGGGIGVPPLLGLSKKMRQQGMKITALLGFNTKENAILIDEFKNYAAVQLATLDGSLGHRGLVTELIKDRDTPVYACGPEALLRALDRLNFTGYYSLERRMACGMGVCLGCNITVLTKDKKELRQRVCYDGPVFPLGSVKWGEAGD